MSMQRHLLLIVVSLIMAVPSAIGQINMVKPGEPVGLRFDPANARYFSADGKRLR